MYTNILSFKPLATQVLVVAVSRLGKEMKTYWSAYVDSVPGESHKHEAQGVTENGTKLSETIARAIFPEFEDIDYWS